MVCGRGYCVAVVERVGVARVVVDGIKGVMEGIMVKVPLLRLEVTVPTAKAAVGVAPIPLEAVGPLPSPRD